VQPQFKRMGGRVGDLKKKEKKVHFTSAEPKSQFWDKKKSLREKRRKGVGGI